MNPKTISGNLLLLIPLLFSWSVLLFVKHCTRSRNRYTLQFVDPMLFLFRQLAKFFLCFSFDSAHKKIPFSNRSFFVLYSMIRQTTKTLKLWSADDTFSCNGFLPCCIKVQDRIHICHHSLQIFHCRPHVLKGQFLLFPLL